MRLRSLARSSPADPRERSFGRPARRLPTKRRDEGGTHGALPAYGCGEEPLFPPPAIRDYEEADLLFVVKRTNVFEVAPWLSVGNTFDFMHLRYVHNLDFKITPEDIRYVEDFHIKLEIPFASPETGPFEQRIRVTGTNAVSFLTVTDHTTIGLFTSTPVGRSVQTYYVAAVPKDPTLAHAELEKRLIEQQTFEDDLLLDDTRTLKGIQFKVGTSVVDDRAMRTHLQWVDRFPRSRGGAADSSEGSARPK